MPNGSIISVSPFRCVVWPLHERLEETISERSCAEEIESFKAHGQRTPAIGRVLRNMQGYDVEIVSGARRLFAARVLNVELIVEIRDLSDRDAVIQMHTDGLRKDISPYERGLAYLQWMRSNLFASQDEMAAALKVSESHVSRLLKLARLPSVIVNAFGNGADICESWGERLAGVLEDPDRSRPAIRAARAIASNPERLTSREAYQRILAAAAPTAPGGRKVARGLHDKVIHGKDGAPLFRIRHQRDSIVLILPMDKISAKTLAIIQSAVERILIESSTDVKTSLQEFDGFQVANA